MRTVIPLAAGDGFSIDEVRIREDSLSWTRPEYIERYRLVFVRVGFFRLHLANERTVVDPTTAFVAHPGESQRIAHHVGVEDVCTSVSLSEDYIDELADPRRDRSRRSVLTTGRIDLAHRSLVARARRGADDFEIAERVTSLLYDFFHEHTDGATAVRLPSSAETRRRAVETTRELLASDPISLGLAEIARLVGVSTHYLSRIFHLETGETLTKFRNRLRVRAALERIEAGEADLALLATDLGFSDHAHLTRTVKDEVGGPPVYVRRLFAGASA
jgi:AraC-like DNA-binding protein